MFLHNVLPFNTWPLIPAGLHAAHSSYNLMLASRIQTDQSWNTITNGRNINVSMLRSIQVDADIDKVFLHGMDKQGRPCITVAAATFMVANRDVTEVSHSVCSILDRAVQQVILPCFH